MLWMCLYFPNLPLEIHTRGGNASVPLATFVKESGRDYVSLCNETAARFGVRAGQRLSTAQALCGELWVKPRDVEAEYGALQKLAACLSQFSSFISLEGSQTLFLEVGGSVRLFGGGAALTQQLCADVHRLGYVSIWAVAPFPRAAALLARAGCSLWLEDGGAVSVAVGKVEIDALALPANTRKSLQSLGLQRVADCFALPSSGLAKRLGMETVTYLNQLRGSCGRTA